MSDDEKLVWDIFRVRAAGCKTMEMKNGSPVRYRHRNAGRRFRAGN